ncbi:alpha/beta fold hydrolase [Aureimonas glaciei]|uniref:Epoxide hydrolase n=1 Tax=Aureimonas glaciei TaxID=1776957 RepID=A0A916XWT5_9HYPH|nr:alpha/beta hydrolase [Aureimonas glaciei]GGD16178.1 epoxide hydrolase [Aureimonas glaciei]
MLEDANGLIPSGDALSAPAVEHRFVDTGLVKLHVACVGPPDGQPIILLHGFPDHWIGWKHQIPALAAAGYRLIIPDQRGYNTSDKPAGVRAYALGRLVEDISLLARAMEIERFHLIGHDWGGIVAWALAAERPAQVKKLVILNAPHPDALFGYALRSPTQFLRSAYVGFFQFPWLPEALLAARGSKVLERAVVGMARPGAFSAEDLALYRQAWRQPRALTSMLNWYRALRYRPSYPEMIKTPTLVLWGRKDTALEPGLADASARRCTDARVVFLPEATHWLHREMPGVVNAEILDFLGG